MPRGGGGAAAGTGGTPVTPQSGALRGGFTCPPNAKRLIRRDEWQVFHSLLQNKWFYLFCISMLPIVELRGGIPAGAAMGLPFWSVYLTCVLGNLLPVPFLILFAKKILEFLSTLPRIGGFFKKMIRRADEKAAKIGQYEKWGLFLFVAIPLPGTGAWTGTLAASLLDMDFKESVLACMGGVLLAGCIMGVLSTLGISAFGAIAG